MFDNDNLGELTIAIVDRMINDMINISIVKVGLLVRDTDSCSEFKLKSYLSRCSTVKQRVMI